MKWLNRLPLLNLVILAVLYVAVLALRALLGTSRVIFEYVVDEAKGGAATFVLRVVRPSSKEMRPPSRWELVPYDFGAVDYFTDTDEGLSPESKEWSSKP